MTVQSTFAQLLGTLDDGNTHNELTDAVTQMVSSLNREYAARGGKLAGKITLTLSVKLDGGMVEIVPDIKVTEPKSARGKTAFWSTEDNRLTRQNPRQGTLPLRDVGGPVANAQAI